MLFGCFTRQHKLICGQFPQYFRFQLRLVPALHRWCLVTQSGSFWVVSTIRNIFRYFHFSLSSSHRNPNRKLSIMRFNSSLDIDFKKWTEPKLERENNQVKLERENNQVKLKGSQKEQLKSGAGSEYDRSSLESPPQEARYDHQKVQTRGPALDPPMRRWK